MGENIGDLGGLEMAYTAYKLSLNGQGGAGASTASPAISASSWRTRRCGARMMRDDALRKQMLTNPHSPPAARGSIPERNMDAWYAAFGVKPGDKLYLPPEHRVQIW